VTDARFAKVSAGLLGWQYMFTSVTPEVLRIAGNDAKWVPAHWPLKQALWYLTLEPVGSDDAARLAALLVAHCYLDAVVPDTRRVLLQGVAEALARRSDAARTLRLFRGVLGRAFSLNAAGQLDAVATLAAWWAEYGRRKPH
jgi:hypothetical protein